MIGSSASLNSSTTIPGGTGNFAADIAVGLPAGQASQVYAAGAQNGSAGWAPWVFVGLAVVYLGWAVLVQHERLQESIRPANVGANFHNLINVTMLAILGIVGGKIAFTKLTALGVPGASFLAQIWAAA